MCGTSATGLDRLPWGQQGVPLDIIYEKLCDDETGKGLRWKIISVVMPSCYG